MKNFIIVVIIFFQNFSFYAQENLKKEFEPVSIKQKCLEEAIRPRNDSIQCYSFATKYWIPAIDLYVKELNTKLDSQAKNDLNVSQEKWLLEFETILKETNLIIENKSLSLNERRKAAIKQFNSGLNRAEYLIKLIDNNQ